MYQVTQDFDRYAEKLKDTLKASTIFHGILVIILVAMTIFIVLYQINEIKGNHDHPKTKRKKTIMKSKRKKDIIIFIVSLIFCSVCIIGVVVLEVDFAIDCMRDIKNQDFVIHDSGFVLSEEITPNGRLTSTTEYKFGLCGKKLDLYSSDNYGFDEGTYTDVILVYSVRSKVVLDMIKKQ